SFVNLTSVHPGYDPSNVLTFEVGLPDARYGPALPEELVARLRSVPGVRAAGYTAQLPAMYFIQSVFVTLSRTPIPELVDPEGVPPPPPPPPPPGAGRPPENPDGRIVSADYFRTMGIGIVAGRVFDNRDRAGAQQVIVINRALARSGLFGENPIGQQI